WLKGWDPSMSEKQLKSAAADGLDMFLRAASSYEDKRRTELGPLGADRNQPFLQPGSVDKLHEIADYAGVPRKVIDAKLAEIFPKGLTPHLPKGSFQNGIPGAPASNPMAAP